MSPEALRRGGEASGVEVLYTLLPPWAACVTLRGFLKGEISPLSGVLYSTFFRRGKKVEKR